MKEVLKLADELLYIIPTIKKRKISYYGHMTVYWIWAAQWLYYQPGCITSQGITSQAVLPARLYYQPGCITSQAVLPARLYYQPGCITSQAVLPARLYYQPGCITSQAVLPARLYYQPGCITSQAVFPFSDDRWPQIRFSHATPSPLIPINRCN